MFNWRDVRTFKEMNCFLSDFRMADADVKEDILAQMVLMLHQYREREAQTDLFAGQSNAPTSRVKRSQRIKRTRRARANT